MLVGQPEDGLGAVKRIRNMTLLGLRSAWIVATQRPSLVLSDPPPLVAALALAAARMTGRPFAYYFTDSWTAVASQATSNVVRYSLPAIKALEHLVLSRSHLVVAVTHSLWKQAKATGAACELVWNGVPLSVYRPEGHAWSEAGDTVPYFLYAGTAGHAHGAEIFAIAAKSLWLNDHLFDLVYIGGGARSPVIRQIANQFPDRLKLYPNTEPEVVASALRSAISALSSLRIGGGYGDARPIKTMSGLAAGCPALYAGAGDFALLLREEELGFVSEWDVEAVQASLSAALKEFQDDHAAHLERRRRCATFARREFSLDASSARVVDLLLSARSRSGS